MEPIHETETAGSRRVVVRITRVTIAPLDADNLVGGVKGLLDVLRCSFPSIIRDDRPEDIDLRCRQTRCRSKAEQGTWVEIFHEEE